MTLNVIPQALSTPLSTPSSLFSSSFFLFVTVSHSCPEITKNASLSVK